MRTVLRSVLVCSTASVLAIMGVQPARAATGSTISLDAGTFAMTYTAGSGHNNRTKLSVTVENLADHGRQFTWTVSDNAPITPGANCSTPDPSNTKIAQCTVTVGQFADFYPEHQFYLGDGSDRIDFSAADQAPSHLGGIAAVHGGPGNDVLTGTGDEYLFGDAGNDTLTNGLTVGGDGNDTIIHSDDAQGGAGNDVITGTNNSINGAGDTLNGGDGNDRIDGRGGPDTILGGAGNDYLLGGSGDDTIYGNSGNDTIYGNSGNDTISGGPGKDKISGGPGHDHITS